MQIVKPHLHGLIGTQVPRIDFLWPVLTFHCKQIIMFMERIHAVSLVFHYSAFPSSQIPHKTLITAIYTSENKTRLT